MIMAKDSNNNYVNIEDIEAKNNNEYQDIEKIVSKQGNLLYNKYKETEDTLPINFKGKGKDLKNYRIYGNTVGGESVGDRTGNLFDGEIEQGSFDGRTGEETSSNIRVRSGKVRLTADNYTISADGVSHGVVYVYDLNGDFIRDRSITTWIELPVNFEIDISYDVRFCFRKNDNSTLIPSDIMNIMLNSDSEPLPYEPYGYRVPVTVSNGTDTLTTPIYLPEQIRKVGDEAEYIDYGEQKLHRVRKNQVVSNVTSRTIDNGDGTFFYITANRDGSVTCNGYAKSTTFISNSYIAELEANTSYILSGCPLGGKYMSYRLDFRTPTGQAIDPIVDYGSGYTFSVDTPGRYVPTVRIAAGYTCDNLTFYPMIRKADISDDTYEPYIKNTDLDVTLPALPTLTGTNVLSVVTAVQPSKVYLKGKLKRTIYGWHVDPDISDSSNAVTYLKDAIGMIPASMGSSTFNYGSWQNAFFMPKPCMLKSNGKVDYYLDPNDYTKKLNGAASDIANPNYDGNAMMQWPKIWFKYVKGIKEGQGYFYVANYKADGNFHCWCNYDSENNEIDHFYTAIYNGTSFTNDTAPTINKMRSLSGVRLTANNGNSQTTTTTEITNATANNTTSAVEWYIETFSDRLLINGLLVLMGKSLNTQAVFGRGLDTGGQSAKEAYVTGTLNDKGLFWGITENGNSGVKVFGMENFWGCCWHRVAGLITDNHVVKLKLTYGTKDGSTVIGYNQTGNGYIDNGTTPYSTGSIQKGFIQKMSYNKYGFMPAVIADESQSTYYADYYYQQNVYYTGIIYALFGGDSASSLATGAFYLYLGSTPNDTFWGTTASLSCKPLLN